MSRSSIFFVLPGTRLRDGLGDFPGEGGAEKDGRISHGKTEFFSGELIEEKGDFSIVLFDDQRDPEGNYKLL